MKQNNMRQSLFLPRNYPWLILLALTNDSRIILLSALDHVSAHSAFKLRIANFQQIVKPKSMSKVPKGKGKEEVELGWEWNYNPRSYHRPPHPNTTHNF